MRIGRLKAEPTNEKEIEGLLHSARCRLSDAHHKRNLAEYEGATDVENNSFALYWKWRTKLQHV